MTHKFFRSALVFPCALTLIVAGFRVSADQVRLRSGKVISGSLSDNDEQRRASGQVRIQVGGAQISLPLSSVVSITTDSLTNNLLIEARYQLKARRVSEGAEILGQAAQQEGAAAQVAAILNDFGDAFISAIPKMTAAGREGLSQALVALDSLPANQAGSMAARRLHLHVALGESDRAEAILNALGPQYFPRHPAEAAALSATLRKTLDAWCSAEDYPRAESVYKILRRVDPTHAEGPGIQFYLQWGSFERRNGRYESALRIYGQSLMALAPQIARDRVETALKEAEQAARAKNQPLDVVPLYETYGVPASPNFAREHLAQIRSQEARDRGYAALWDNKFAPAREAFTQAEKYKPGSAAADLLQCEWRERRAKLKKDDFKGHLDLGDWCVEKQLYDAAIREYSEASGSPELAAAAAEKSAPIQNKKAEKELADIHAIYDTGDYAKVLNEVGRFMREEHPTGYLIQARQIQEMTRDALRMRVAQHPQQAEALYQQAERAFYDADYKKAGGLLETIAQHYSDTPAYPRATALAALVGQKLAVVAMESGKKTAEPAQAQPGLGATITTGTTAQLSNVLDTLPSSGTMAAIRALPTTATLNAPINFVPKVRPTPTPAMTRSARPTPTPKPSESDEREALRKAIKNIVGQ